MRSSFAGRRKPRRLGQNDEDDGGGDVQMQEAPNNEQGSSQSVAFYCVILIDMAPDN